MKLPTNLICGLIVAVMTMGLLFATRGYEQTWQLLGVPSMSPHFADLRVITGAATSITRGYDPMLSNPGDPWLRPLNYPRVWQGLAILGVNDRHTTCLGVSLIVMFLVGLLMAVHCPTWYETVWIMAAVMSPATLLGIERANIDLLMFFLLAAAVSLAQRRHIAAMCVILIAFVLKLYPIFGLTVLLSQSRRAFLVSVAAATVLAVAYVGLTLEDVLLIGAATPRGTDVSYGLNVARLKYSATVPLVTEYGGIIVATAIGVVVLLACTALRKEGSCNHDVPGSSMDSFRIGSGVYLGTFLLGNNFDYRLMFLIFTIPQLLAWSHAASQLTVRLARVALLGIYLSMWHMLIRRYISSFAFMIDEMANWVVFATLLYLLVLTVPPWMLQMLRPTDEAACAEVGRTSKP